MRMNGLLNFIYYRKCITRHLLSYKNSSPKIEYTLMIYIYLPRPFVLHWMTVDDVIEPHRA